MSKYSLFHASLVLIMVTAWAAADSDDPEKAYLDQIELRSVVSLGGEPLFSLSDPGNDRTFWLELGQSIDGLEAIAYDGERNRLTLRFGESERELSLSRSRVRVAEETETDPEPEPEPSTLTPEERRELWRQQREQWRALRERWNAAAEDSPEIRSIENRLREAGEEMRQVMMDLAMVDEGSEGHRRLIERRRELGGEFQSLFRESREILEGHPAFEPGDAEALGRVQRMFPSEF